MGPHCSGVILAGGQNKRFMGRNKAFCEINGQRIIDRIFSVFKSIFDDIILVTNSPELYLDWDVTIVTDIYPVRSSITGIHTGLFYARHPYAFCSACETPFLKKELVECVISRIKPNFDLILPETTAGLEPLCAVYSKDCLTLMEQKIQENKLKIQRIFSKKRIMKIPESVIRKIDPDLISFFNVNCAEDLAVAEKWAMDLEKKSHIIKEMK
jgi:molybdopterin-guanine dinucleotide biosynthesis protein A